MVTMVTMVTKRTMHIGNHDMKGNRLTRNNGFINHEQWVYKSSGGHERLCKWIIAAWNCDVIQTYVLACTSHLLASRIIIQLILDKKIRNPFSKITIWLFNIAMENPFKWRFIAGAIIYFNGPFSSIFHSYVK